MNTAAARHPAEVRIVEILESGATPTVDDFGGAEALLASAQNLGGSRLTAEFIAVVLRSGDGEVERLSPFVQTLLERLENDLVYMEVVDLLDQHQPLPKRLQKACFEALTTAARDDTRGAMMRAAALDGALRLAAGSRPQELRLAAQLLETETTDNPVYLARAARVIGALNSLVDEPGLPECLRRLVAVPDDTVAAEAAHELGMVALGAAFDAGNDGDVLSGLSAARHWFSAALERRETRPESEVFLLNVEFLFAYQEKQGRDVLDILRTRLSNAVFAMHLGGSRTSATAWLGLSHAQGAYFSALTTVLGHLVVELEEASWWEPAHVVENVLLSAYMANRSILRRQSDGGIDVIVRPRIHASLVQERGQAAAVRHWVQRNTSHEWREAADALLAEVNRMTEHEPARPSMAVTKRPSVIAAVEGSSLPSDQKASVLRALESATRVHLENLSSAEPVLLNRCISKLLECPEYSGSAQCRQLMDAVLVWTLRFLSSRINASREHDKTVGYLFELDSGSLPHESKLQDDYHRFMQGTGMGSEIEVSNIAAGRCDVRFTSGGDTVVTEVKRELHDASFRNLVSQYSSQATEYQNTGCRVGILLVLDLSSRRTHGIAHISALVEPVRVMRLGEPLPRWLVVVVVPGRRVVPSEMRGAVMDESEWTK